MDNRKKLIIAITVILALATIAIVWIIIATRQSDEGGMPKTTVTIDPDTGDEIVTVEGKSPEDSPLQTGVTILGGSQFIDRTSINNNQYAFFTAQLELFAKEKDSTVKTIKLLPDSIELLESTPSGVPFLYSLQIKTVNAEESEATYNSTLRLIGLDRIQVTVSEVDSGNSLYDSGVIPRTDEDESHDHGAED